MRNFKRAEFASVRKRRMS